MRNAGKTIAFATTIVFLSLCGAASAASAGQYTELRIFASEAVARPVREVGYIFEKAHPNVQLHYEFTASRVFQIGIIQGIPPDLFISAGTKLQNSLTDIGYIDLADTVAYSRLVAATTCFPPPCCRAPGLIPLHLTRHNLWRYLISPNVKITAASPVLSVAGRYTESAFHAIAKRHRGEYRKIQGHTTEVLNPGLIEHLLETRQTQLGIIYASQAAEMRRIGECVNEVTLPDSPRIPFTVSVLKPSKFHTVGVVRARLDHELKNLYISRTGQKIFEKWGFEGRK